MGATETIEAIEALTLLEGARSEFKRSAGEAGISCEEVERVRRELLRLLPLAQEVFEVFYREVETSHMGHFKAWMWEHCERKSEIGCKIRARVAVDSERVSVDEFIEYAGWTQGS